MSSTPLLSIVIPVYREPFEIVRLLCVLSQCPNIDRTEIVIVDGDNGSSRIPTSILPVEIVSSRPGRGRQLNEGASRSSAPIIAFLHVDTLPPQNFVRLIRRSTERRPAGAFDLHIETDRLLVRAISLMGLVRSRLTRIPYGDQIQFITRELFERVGGFPNDPLMEDVALMDRVADAGEQIAIVRPPAVTSGRRWDSEGAALGTLRNWRIMLAYRSGVSPQALRAKYRPQSEIEADRTILVFHRALRLGEVKTRLASEVGAFTARDLYHAMVKDLRSELPHRHTRVIPFIDTASGGRDLFSGRSVPQQGLTLWERMNDALLRGVASGSSRLLLVGSDIPGLTREVMVRAFRLLERNDWVLGPSGDGGFYLIGVRAKRFTPDLLADAGLDPNRSRQRILDWVGMQKQRIALLPSRTDVDTLDDLRQVLADPSVRARHLRRAARGLGAVEPR